MELENLVRRVEIERLKRPSVSTSLMRDHKQKSSISCSMHLINDLAEILKPSVIMLHVHKISDDTLLDDVNVVLYFCRKDAIKSKILTTTLG